MDGRNITKIARNMMLYTNKKNKYSLNNNEFELVRYVTKHDGLSLKDIASYLNVDKALVTRMVRKLTSEGYIELISDSNDMRKKIIQPKELAFTIKEEEKNEEIKFYNAIFKVLNEEELEKLDELITKVYLESKKYRKNKFEGINDEE